MTVTARSITNLSGDKVFLEDIYIPSNCTINNSGTLSLLGSITGSGGIVHIGNGITTLNNINNYTGPTNIRNGTLKIGNSGTIGSGLYNGFITINGTLDYSSSIDQIITGSVGTYPPDSPLFNNNRYFIVNGPGTFHIRSTFGEFQFDGNLEINGGFLRVGDNDLITTPMGYIGNGTISLIRNILINQSGTLELNRNNAASQSIIGGIIAGDGPINVLGGNYSITRGGSYSGILTINPGSVWNISKPMPNTNFNNNGTLTINATNSYFNNYVFNTAPNICTPPTTYLESIDYVVANGSGSQNITTLIQSAGFGNSASEFVGFMAGKIALVQRGVESFQTKVDNAVNAGAIGVIIYNDVAGLTTPTVTTNIPVIMITQSLGQQLITQLGSSTVISRIDTTSSLPIFDNNISGSGTIIKAGDQLLTTDISPSFTGQISINSGRLRISNLGGVTSIRSSNGTYEILGGTTIPIPFYLSPSVLPSVGNIRNISDNNTLSGPITLNSYARINSDSGLLILSNNISGAFQTRFGGSGNIRVDGVIVDASTITKDGTGTLELTSANTFTNSATISDGILKLSGNGTIPAPVTNNAQIILENNDGIIHANSMTGSGTLVKNLTTKTIMTGTLGHTGITTINAGILAIGSGGSTGSTTGSGAFIIASGATLEINRSTASTFTRPVSGEGAIIVLGGGTASFTSDLTHTGGTTVSAGIMSIGAGGTVGSITGNIIANGTIQFNRSDSYTYADIISGTGNLIKAGIGTTTLTGNNSYNGATLVNGGALRASQSNAFGTSIINIATNSTIEMIGGLTINNNFTINGGGVSNGGAIRSLSDSNTINGAMSLVANSRINSDIGNLVLNGNISGNFQLLSGGSGNIIINGALTNASLLKDGIGILELTANNTYSTTSVNAGTLKLSGIGSFGAGAVTNNAAIVIENNDGTIIPRNISGSGTLTKNLNTKVIFTGTLSYTGETTVNNGTFAIGNGGTIGDASGAGSFVLNSGTILEINRNNASTFSRPVSGDGAILVLGGGTSSFTNNLTHTGGTTVSSGTMSIGAGGTVGSITGNITNNATIQFNRSDAYAYDGIISGTGNLVKVGAGTTTLTGNNTYNGTTTVSVGALRIASNNAIGTSNAIISSNAAMEIASGLSISNNITINGFGISSGGAIRSISDLNILNGTTTLGSAARINSDIGNLVLNGNISGVFGLIIGGSGNTIISGIITNPTTLTKSDSGTLELTSINTYTSTTSISAGTLKLTGIGTVGAGSIVNNATFVIENNDLTTIPRDISGSGNIIKNLNTKIILTGTITNTGTTTVNSGTLAIGSGGTTGSFSGSAGNFVINSGTTLEINRSNANQFSRALSGEGSLVILGGGTATFNTSLTHTGGTTISAGTMSIGAGGTAGSITGDILNNAAVQFSRSDAYTYAGIISGTGNLIKIAAGTTTLTGSNSYSGTTTISGGSLRIAHANALGSGTSTISIPANTALELIGGISLSRNLSSASAGISSGGSLRNISGNNILNGNYIQTNASRINSDSDTLTLSNSGTLSGTFTLTLGGSGNINVERAIAISTAGLTKDGSGTVLLSAANTYTGTTTLSGGTTRFATVQSLYNNNTANWIKTKIIVNTGAVFAINVGGTNEFTTANVSTLLTNLLTTINNNGLRSGSSIGFDTTNSPSDFTISSNITNSTGTGSGSVGVVKLGIGTLILSGSNTYSGQTTINAGTLKAGNATCFGTSTIVLNAGATLDLSGFTISNTIINNGGTIIN